MRLPARAGSSICMASWNVRFAQLAGRARPGRRTSPPRLSVQLATKPPCVVSIRTSATVYSAADPPPCATTLSSRSAAGRRQVAGRGTRALRHACGHGVLQPWHLRSGLAHPCRQRLSHRPSDPAQSSWGDAHAPDRNVQPLARFCDGNARFTLRPRSAARAPPTPARVSRQGRLGSPYAGAHSRRRPRMRADRRHAVRARLENGKRWLNGDLYALAGELKGYEQQTVSALGYAIALGAEALDPDLKLHGGRRSALPHCRCRLK